MDRRKFLATAGASLAAPALKAIPGEAEGVAPSRIDGREQPPRRPNVIVMICDDLGYGDLGCYGSKLSTPNIDRLAASGVRCMQHCTPTPVCSASRAALMTGLYPTRVNAPTVYFPLDQDGMSLDATTIANVLKKADYKTMAIGKWHLGHAEPYMPTNRGFEQYYGVPYSVDMEPLPLLHNLQVLEPEADRNLLTPQYTEQAVKFIRESKNAPFFLYMAYSYPHIPLHASKKFRGRSRSGLYGDVVREIDWSVGEVVKTLKQNGLEENTLVIFTSDHGPWYQGSTGNLRGRKGSTYEGGVRIPMIASLPGTLSQGQVVNGLTSHLDMLPTLTKLCGGTLPQRPLDGTDIWPILAGTRESVERKALLNFFAWDLQCARWKQWKLHVSRYNVPLYLPVPARGRINYALRNPELYNLDEDPKESYDTATEYPEVVASIQKSILEQLHTLPDRVQKAYTESQAHPSSQWMPPDSFPESVNMRPPSPEKLREDEMVLQRFRAMERGPK
jgi:arylsulfatase A